MRIGVIARRLLGQPFGIGRYMQYLLKYWSRLARPTERFILYVPAPPKSNGLLQLSDAFEFAVVPPDIQGIVWENFVLPRRAKEVDVLFGPSYTIPLTFSGRSVVATHSVNEAQAGAHPWWYKVTYTPWYRLSAHKADRVIVPSRSTLEDIQKLYGVSAAKVSIVPEGVDESFQPIEDDALLRRTREKYFGTDRPYVLFVGKLSQRRHIPELMTAFSRVKKKHGLPHGLLLMGPNVLGLPLAGLAQELGIADCFVQYDEKFPDHRGIVAVYNAADLYVYPSSYDGFSLTLLEALACGLPAVTVNRAALREIAEGCALMVEEPTVDALAGAIEGALLDRGLRQELRRKGLERARTLRWDQTARLTLDVLREVALGKGS
jgi:glycosyltransferase involved in cell wall biosynthesis